MRQSASQSVSDPFMLLGIRPDADDAAVRAAYHDRVRAGTADAQINAAYASIRSPAARERLRFTAMTSYIAEPPSAPTDAGSLLDPTQCEAVIRECVSLSDWELGDV
jgi:hypothetical protein